MAGGPFASIRIAERFRYRASTTTADREASVRITIRTDRQRKQPPQQAKIDPQAPAADAAPAEQAPAPANTSPEPSTATANVAPADTATSTPASRPARLRRKSSRTRPPPPSPRRRRSLQRRRGGAEPEPATSAVQAANSPLGVWLTEEKEGKVRIEQCGANLCGYSVDAKSNQNGEQVLINMKPGKDSKWSGRILDPNTGSTYDSTIALKGSDTSCGFRVAPSAACSAAARPGAGSN